MRYQMDNYEQPTRRQMRPTETEDVAVKVRVRVHMWGEMVESGVRTEKEFELMEMTGTQLPAFKRYKI